MDKEVNLSLSSQELRIILCCMGTFAKYAPGSPSNETLNDWESETRFWLCWNQSCVHKGFQGHDESIVELELRLRLINEYKNALAKEKLAKGF